MKPNDGDDKKDTGPTDGGKTDVEEQDPKPNESLGSSPPQDWPLNGEDGHRAEPPKNWWDKAKPFVEIAGVVLLAIYTTFTVSLFYQNRNEFAGDQRPWIWIDEEHAHGTAFKKDNVVRFNLPIKNFGKSPAIKVDAYLEIDGNFFGDSTVAERVDGAFSAMLANRIQSRHNLFVLPAGAILNYPLTLNVSKQILGQEGLRTIVQFGEAPGSWVVTGRITYSDAFGNSHVTDTCTYNAGMFPSDTEPEMAACPDHNQMQ